MEHPAALLRLIVALRLAFGIALVVAVTVEVAADPRGVGNAIMVAQQALQPALCVKERRNLTPLDPAPKRLWDLMN